jgi:hypothetical protein
VLYQEKILFCCHEDVWCHWEWEVREYFEENTKRAYCVAESLNNGGELPRELYRQGQPLAMVLCSAAEGHLRSRQSPEGSVALASATSGS